jgi:hypothetical protein
MNCNVQQQEQATKHKYFSLLSNVRHFRHTSAAGCLAFVLEPHTPATFIQLATNKAKGCCMQASS